MHSTEAVVVKVLPPTKRKAAWLEQTAAWFSGAVQYAIDTAQELRTSSRAKIHKAAYHNIRNRFGLPADYTRMAVNVAVSLARSYYGLRKSKHQRRTSFPKVTGSQGIGLGVNAYKLVWSGTRWALRCATGVRGEYIWLPLCVPQKFHKQLVQAKGDAKLFERDGNWYAMLPVRTETSTPTASSGERTFIGVDLGVVQLATVATPDCVHFFNGKPVRHRREHFADIRRRYQRHGRIDKVKAMRGKERRWMKDINHKISCQLVQPHDVELGLP
jgi:putative transposase